VGYAHVQGTGGTIGSAVPSFGTAYPVPVVAGDLLRVAVVSYNSSVVTHQISDTLLNAWTQVGGYQTSGNLRLSVWEAVANGSGSTTVTATASGGGMYWTMAVDEYAGEAASYDDSSNTGSGVGANTTPATGTVPVAGPAELLYAALTWVSAYAGTATAGPGCTLRYTQPSGAGANMPLVIEDNVSVSAGTAASWSMTGAGPSLWVALAASSKPAAGGGPWPFFFDQAMSGGTWEGGL
jgi:hypothetical protein